VARGKIAILPIVLGRNQEGGYAKMTPTELQAIRERSDSNQNSNDGMIRLDVQDLLAEIERLSDRLDAAEKVCRLANDFEQRRIDDGSPLVTGEEDALRLALKKWQEKEAQ